MTLRVHSAACPLDCPDACGVLVESDPERRFHALRGNPQHSWSRGSLCGKTSIFADVVRSKKRLRVPLIRKADGRGTWREASWEQALDHIAERIAPLAGDEILALFYAGCMGFVNRYYPMRVMNALGAVKTDGGLCDTSATEGYATVMGHAIGPDLEHVQDSDLVVVWGADLRRTHQHFLPRVVELAKRGVTVWTLDVWRTDTIRHLERFGCRSLILAPGSDAALALALCRAAYEGGFADREFLARECLGADKFEAHASAAPALEQAARTCGLDLVDVRAFAADLARSQRPLIKVGVGFARRRNGAMNMRAVCSLGAVLGQAERFHYESFDHFGLSPDVIECPDLHPADTPPAPIRHIELGRELEKERFRAAFVWGHNPAVTVPDSKRVRAGLAREGLFLVVHELFMTETAELADVVLPATTFVEQRDVFRSYNHRLLHYVREACEAPHEQRSNVDAFRSLAQRLELPEEVWKNDEQALCHELLEASRERFADEEYERLLRGEPVKLSERKLEDYGTPSGKIELVSERAAAAGQPAMATYVPDDYAGGQGEWILISAPSIATHNSTYSYSTRHAARAGKPRVFLHPDDAARLGVAAGQQLRLSNEQGALTAPVEPTADMPRGLLRIDGLPRAQDVPEGIGVNALVPGAISDLGESNVLYSTRVDAARVS